MNITGLNTMSVMNKEVYEALLEAGASAEKASSAATSVADYQKDMSDVKQKLAELKGDMTVLKWGVALIIAVEVLPYLKNLVGA